MFRNTTRFRKRDDVVSTSEREFLAKRKKEKHSNLLLFALGLSTFYYKSISRPDQSLAGRLWLDLSSKADTLEQRAVFPSLTPGSQKENHKCSVSVLFLKGH